MKAPIVAALLGVPLVAFSALLTSSIHAAPLRYQIELIADSELPAHPLDGANLKLDITWDASIPTPRSSSTFGTFYLATNSIGFLTVTGSATADGVYDATFIGSVYSGWSIDNDLLGWDRFTFPLMSFEIGGKTVDAGILSVKLPNSFVTGPHPYLPKPFAYADGNWSTVGFRSYEPSSEVTATVVAASVTAVPEPATAASLAIAGLGLLAFRRCN